jgi:hypothetical protein
MRAYLHNFQYRKLEITDIEGEEETIGIPEPLHVGHATTQGCTEKAFRRLITTT